MPDGDSPAKGGDTASAAGVAGAEAGGAAVLTALSTCLADWQHTERWGDFVDALVKVETAAMQAGHLALHDVCAVLHERIEQLSAVQERPDEEQCAVLATWPSFAMAWLESPGEPHQAELLVEFLAHPMWPQPLDSDEAAALKEMLVVESGAHGSASLLEVVIENMDSTPAQPASADAEEDDGLPGYDGLSGYAVVGTDLPGGGRIVPDVRASARTGRDGEEVEDLSAGMDLGTAALADSPAPAGPGDSRAHAAESEGSEIATPTDTIDGPLLAEHTGGVEPLDAAEDGANDDHLDVPLKGPDALDDSPRPVVHELGDAASEPAFFDAGGEALEASAADDVQGDDALEPAFFEAPDEALEASAADDVQGDDAPEPAFFEAPDEALEASAAADVQGEDAPEPAFFEAPDEALEASAADDALGEGDAPEPAFFDAPDETLEASAADDALGEGDAPEPAFFEAPDEALEASAADDALGEGDAPEPAFFEAPDEALEASAADDALGEGDAPEPAFFEADDEGLEHFGADDGGDSVAPAAACFEPLEDAREASTAEAGATGALTDSANEMIHLLTMEASQIATVLDETLPLATDTGADAAERRAAIEHFAEQVERFNGAVELVGLEGLGRAGGRFHQNILALAERDAAMGAESAELLVHVCTAISDYLEHPAEPITGAALTSLLSHPAWPQPASPDWSAEVETLLASPAVDIEDDDVEQRAVRAVPENVSLALPDDVDNEVLDGLLQDLPGQTAEFSSTVETLLAGGTARDLEVAQRIAHTVKGAANTVGVAGLANLTHHLEDILLALSKHGVMPGRALGEVLVRASDCLESMGEALLGQGAAPDDALETLQSVLDWANTIDNRGVAAVADDRAPQPHHDETETESEIETDRGAHMQAEARTQAPVAATAMVRVPAPLVDDLLRLVGETIILSGQIQERLDVTARETQNLRKQYLLVQQLGQEMEELIDLQDLSLPMQRVVNGEAFDALEFDQYNELHTCSRRLVEAATDTREVGQNIEEHLSTLKDMLSDQARLNRENQEAVLKTRMVAVQTIVPRLQRSVRQASRLSGKAVELDCVGSDTLIDSDVLGRLLDPLMHVLRNAVDHGIESEAKRIEAGKDVTGKVTLEFQREGNHIVIRCSDDGAGLDLDAIKRAAEMRDLIGENAQPSDDELIQLVLRPNFSTRTEATQLSGRGIGLDAVNTQIVELGGSLRLQSKSGKGAQIILRLPLTLVSTHALLVRVTSHVLAVATRGVEQILHPDTGEVSHFGDQSTYRMVDAVYPCTTLSRLLGLPGERRSSDREHCPALLVLSDGGLHVVLVDGVVDSRELVIKSMGRYLPKIRGLAGATILGDGSVTPVLDLPELLREPARHETPRPGRPGDATGIDVHMPYALVVDDSLSARRSLAQFMTDSGFQVRTARDGIDAVKIMQTRKPDVLLVDLEMPRMNGLELTHHVRANEDTRDVPVIMITSRSTEKHRKQAEAAGVTEYLTKPYAEDELIEHVYSVCTGR